MFSVWNALGIIGAILQLTIVWLLLKGPYRTYPLLLVYCLARLATTGIEIAVSLAGGVNTRKYFYVYWTNDAILKGLLFLLVIVLIYQAMEGNPKRATVGRWLGLVVIGAGAIITLLAYNEPGGWPKRLTIIGGRIAFSAALLNVVLWTALLKQPRRDVQLMLVSAGLGIEVTGEAIAHSLRQMISRGGPVFIPDLFLVATHFLSLYIWWRAFRGATTPQAKPASLP